MEGAGGEGGSGRPSARLAGSASGGVGKPVSASRAGVWAASTAGVGKVGPEAKALS